MTYNESNTSVIKPSNKIFMLNHIYINCTIFKSVNSHTTYNFFNMLK